VAVIESRCKATWTQAGKSGARPRSRLMSNFMEHSQCKWYKSGQSCSKVANNCFSRRGHIISGPKR
jgi:hypothetical protein